MVRGTSGKRTQRAVLAHDQLQSMGQASLSRPQIGGDLDKLVRRVAVLQTLAGREHEGAPGLTRSFGTHYLRFFEDLWSRRAADTSRAR